MTTNDCYRPSVDAQLRYTVQWFNEWSEMQRDDFLPILTEKLAPANYVHVNGLIPGMDSLGCGEGRPPSLFQCRIKLFREWVDGWSQTERDQLLAHIQSMDPGFHARLQDELGAPNGDVIQNGETPIEEKIEFLGEAAVDVAPQNVMPDVIAPVINSNNIMHEDKVTSEPEVESESVVFQSSEPDVVEDLEGTELSSPDVE